MTSIWIECFSIGGHILFLSYQNKWTLLSTFFCKLASNFAWIFESEYVIVIEKLLSPGMLLQTKACVTKYAKLYSNGDSTQIRR
jgi:hypothetical protein